MRLLRAEDAYRRLSSAQAEAAFLAYPPLFVDRAPPPQHRRGETDARATTTARVNQGRWVADCPFCRSAQVVTPADPRYLCAGPDGCANGAIGGAYARVIFPGDGDVVEALLLARPDREQRNWLPHETVDDLRAENAERGIE